MLPRYERNWKTLRRTRIALVKRAARHPEAMDHLRTMAMHAGVFAALSVRNQVTKHEQQYARWLRGEPITDGLATHRDAPANIGAWVATMPLGIMRDKTGRAFIDAAIAAKGIGAAKSHFYAALMGYDEAVCLDIHMCESLGITESERATWTTSRPGMLRYRAAVERSGMERTLDQWKAFLAVPRFALEMHDVYFRSVLGDEAIVR